jgi:sporulation protein YlmC with PRC-barrel domain
MKHLSRQHICIKNFKKDLDMKKLHSFLFYALVAPAITLSAGSLMAQQSTVTGNTAQQNSVLNAPASSQYRGYLSTIPVNATKASDLTGAKIQTHSDEEIGSVQELIIDENGQVIAILVNIGGFLGMGKKEVAIGWSHVTLSGTPEDRVLLIDVSSDDLKEAPEYKPTN